MSESRGAEPDRRVSVVSLLDHLEHLILAGRRVPFTSGLLVNDEEVLEILDRARLSLPDDVVRAHQTAVDREQMMRAAEAEGERVIAQGRQQAEQLIARAEQEGELLVRHAQERAETLSSNHAIVQTAQQHAAEILGEADARAEAVRTEADQYARDIMQRLEDQLVRTLTTVRKGLDSLPASPPSRRRRPAPRE